MRIALGTAQFGMSYGLANRRGQVPSQEVKEILAWAKLSAIDTIDTAIAYGESEMHLGLGGVTDFKVVTKLPLVPSDCRDVVSWAKAHVLNSLQRLGISCLHGLLLHNVEQLSGPHGAAPAVALQLLRDAGYVKKIGISIYSPADIELATSVCTLDLVQAPFNLLDRRLLESGWLDKLSKQGVEVHVRSAFLQGLLLMSASEVPARFSPWSKLFTIWHRWLIDHPETAAAHACLDFVYAHPQIDRVVVGVDSLHQLKQIVSLSGVPLRAELPNLSCTDEMLINPSNWK